MEMAYFCERWRATTTSTTITTIVDSSQDAASSETSVPTSQSITLAESLEQKQQSSGIVSGNDSTSNTDSRSIGDHPRDTTGNVSDQVRNNDVDYDPEPDLLFEPNPISFHGQPGVEGSQQQQQQQQQFLLDTTDQDLVAALWAIGIRDDDDDEIKDANTSFDKKGETSNDTLDDKENNNISLDVDDTWTGSTSTSPLPDIEFELGDGDDQDIDHFFIPPDQFDSIFDDNPIPIGTYRDRSEGDDNDDDDDNNNSALEKGDYDDTAIGGNIHLVEDPETAVGLIDKDTEDLYRELANLDLNPVSPDPTEEFAKLSINTTATTTTTISTTNKDSTITAESIMEDSQIYGGYDVSDFLPPYLYCQPCTPESELFDPLPPNLSSIGEDEVLENLSVERQTQLMAAAREFQELLQQDPDVATLLRLEEEDALIQQMDAIPNVRQQARDEATPYLNAFGVQLTSSSNLDPTQSNQEQQCSNASKQRAGYVHRESIFGIAMSPCGRFCASASQDSTVTIWNVATNSVLARFQDHSKAYECLRVAWASPNWASQDLDRTDGTFRHLVASGGADGVVKLWSCSDPLNKESAWTCQYTLDHGALRRDEKAKNKNEQEISNTEEPQDGQKVEDNKPQTYTLQFIDHWQAFTTGGTNQANAQNSFLMTSSDEFIHLWEIELERPTQCIQLGGNDTEIQVIPDKLELREVMSLHFGSLKQHGFGVTPCSVTGQGLQLPPPPSSTNQDNAEQGFGGERNPENKVFVFDATYCSANGLLGVALSDGSLRLMNGRGICISILNLPGCQSHLTSFCWDSTGTKLATSVASGHLITWKLDIGDVQGKGTTVATCTAIMEGGHQPGRPLFGSLYCGRDENLLLSWGVDGNLCLWDSQSQGNIYSPMAVLKSDAQYPIYAAQQSKDTLVVGGGSDGGFIGVPLYFYTFGDAKNDTTIRSPNPKRPTESTPTESDATTTSSSSVSQQEKKKKT